MNYNEIKNSFWQSEPNFWLQQLNSRADGLTDAEVQQIKSKQKKHVKNKSSFEQDIKLFLSQFKSPLMLLLIGAVIISGFLGDTSDVFIILFIVLSTGILSFIQERNAGKVVQKLQSLISIKSTVLRGGKEVEIRSDEIVVGDIIVLHAGDLIPADCLIIDCNELYVNESTLTGESYPTFKNIGALPSDTELSKRHNCLWEGTSIVSGVGKVLVMNTGENTIFGSLAQSAKKSVETAFEKGIKEFGFFLMRITLILSGFILVVNLINNKSLIESALFALALAIGMAPELLPAITTIAMSAGAKRMLDKKVIVKKLNSIQNLGEVNLLCTDKTGTITEGKIEISSVLDASGKPSLKVKSLAYWNACFETGYSNPIDEALKNMEGVSSEGVNKIGEVPYDFIRKRVSIAVATSDEKILISKGAFNQIHSICTRVQFGETIEEISAHRKDLVSMFEQFGKDGLRVIAVCYNHIEAVEISRQIEKDMIFAGFILMHDPIKSGIADTIAALNELHVGLKIITGDNKSIAQSIAIQIGLSQPSILTGKEIESASEEVLQKQVVNTHIFAEVEPHQKEQIILALKRNYTVAYMGDGINDVSAIHAADVGISVDNATDVARDSADFVLMEKDLMVLVDGIREGRRTFANTMKYLYINTGATFGNMFSVAVASLLLPFLPMLPKQILLTNFLTDFPYLSVAGDNVDHGILNRPGKWNTKIIRNYMIYFGIHSSLFDIITFATLFFALRTSEPDFQTGWFIESILTELCILFIIRTHRSFTKSKPGKYLLILSILSFILTLMLPYSFLADDIGLKPMPLFYLSLIFGIVILYIITADMLKIWFFKKYADT